MSNPRLTWEQVIEFRRRPKIEGAQRVTDELYGCARPDKDLPLEEGASDEESALPTKENGE